MLLSIKWKDQEEMFVNVWRFPWCWNSLGLCFPHSLCGCFDCLTALTVSVVFTFLITHSHDGTKIDWHVEDGYVHYGYYVWIFNYNKSGAIEHSVTTWDPYWRQNGYSKEKILYFWRTSPPKPCDHLFVSVHGPETTSATGSFSLLAHLFSEFVRCVYHCKYYY